MIALYDRLPRWARALLHTALALIGCVVAASVAAYGLPWAWTNTVGTLPDAWQAGLGIAAFIALFYLLCYATTEP